MASVRKSVSARKLCETLSKHTPSTASPKLALRMKAQDTVIGFAIAWIAAQSLHSRTDATLQTPCGEGFIT